MLYTLVDLIILVLTKKKLEQSPWVITLEKLGKTFFIRNNLFMSVPNLVLLTYFIYVHVIIVAGQLVTNEHVL